MNKIVVVLLVLGSLAISQHMIVRVYTSSQQDLKLLSEKTLDIAAARAGEWYDIVADRALMDRIINSGLTYEVRVLDIDYAKENVRAQYHSYAEVTTLLRNMAGSYPSICKLDSLPLRTYEGRWLYGVKISDEPSIEDPNEPGLLIDALHHSREWATIELVLFFADSMLKSYGVVPQITNIINSTEIYCFPIINADGYVYDYPAGNWWRRNREPFGGGIGNDPNRNYPASAGILSGDWGAVDGGKATHYPDDDLFCGPWPNSGDETRALVQYAKSHVINAYMSYHSYSEYLMWGWGFTTGDIPDATLCTQKGNYMASLITRLGGGTYLPGQIPEILYSVSGSSIDWFYSWNHYV
ncbi:MAG TPA: M14 family zinc carboxypeptidase, partial [bacterium]